MVIFPICLVFFFQKNGLKPEDVHIIGHSLGSHTAGYAGSATKNLGRITGKYNHLTGSLA